MSQFTPSPKIDAAVCDLIVCINQFSDKYFDAEWCKLTDVEIEDLLVKLLTLLAKNLEGKVLASYVNEIRTERQRKTAEPSH